MIIVGLDRDVLDADMLLMVLGGIDGRRIELPCRSTGIRGRDFPASRSRQNCGPLFEVSAPKRWPRRL
jgi:hypothetical protein